jgi:hypothetical protein
MAENPVNLGEIAQVVNRTSKPLTYLVDGRRYTLKPGVNQVLDFHIPFAMAQNVLPGSADPNVPSRYESLIGVPGKTDCDELLDEYLALLPHERLDRSLLPKNRQTVRENEMSQRDMPRRRVGLESPTVGFTDPGDKSFGG